MKSIAVVRTSTRVFALVLGLLATVHQVSAVDTTGAPRPAVAKPQLAGQVNPGFSKLDILPGGYRAIRIAEAHLTTGRKIYGFQGASINDQGRVAYVVIYDDTGPGQYSVMLFDGSSSITLAAGGPTLPVSSNTRTHINNPGDVVFRTPTSNAGTTIWLWRANNLIRVQGTQASPYNTLGEPQLNDAGQVVYRWGSATANPPSLNSGLAIWFNGTTTLVVDETAFNKQYFIGDGFFSGSNVYFAVMTKSSWTAKGLYLRQGNGQIVQIAAVNQFKLPHQIDRLEADLAGSLYVPTVNQLASGSTNAIMRRSNNGQWQSLLAIGNEWYALQLPYVARNGTYAFWGMCSGANCPAAVAIRESIYVVKGGVRTQVLQVKQRLSGRTIKRLKLHGVNSQGAMVVEVAFEESGQYTTLFRLDPPGGAGPGIMPHPLPMPTVPRRDLRR